MRSEGYSTQFVCVSVTSLAATLLTHRYKVRYESNANALLKVFDSWISLKILCSKVTVLLAHLNELLRFRQQGDTSEGLLETIGRLAAISNTVTHDGQKLLYWAS